VIGGWRAVAQGRDDGGAGACLGLVRVFTERDLTDVMNLILDEPSTADPVLQFSRQGVPGGQDTVK
jgi:hypothetical protein